MKNDSATEKTSRQVLRPGELKDLTTRRDGPGVRRIAFHLTSLLITGSLYWSFRDSWLAIPLMLAHGFVLAFLFCAQHETAHRTAFHNRLLNDLVGQFAGFVLFLPHEGFRAFHWDHHRYTQDFSRDPELANGLPNTRTGIFWLWLGVPNWVSRVKALIRHGILRQVDSPWIPPTQHPRIIREAQAYLTGYMILLGGSIALQTTALVWLWLAPLVCGYWFLRPYLLCEHTGCQHEGSMAAKTNTTRTNRLVSAFAWNMPYHTEHHVYPAVPFHALPALHKLMSSQLIHVQAGYVKGWNKVARQLAASTSQAAANLAVGRESGFRKPDRADP